MKLEYLLFDLVILLSSTGAVFFYKKARFPQVKPTLIAILTMGIPYIVWDMIVTGRWWQFNPAFILGIKIVSLPVEEMLFFLVVPWAILMLWHNRLLLGKSHPVTWGWWVWGSIIVLGFWVGLQSLYGLIVTSLFVGGVALLGKKVQQSHWVYLLITIVVATAIFNMYLTMRPIVVYQAKAISGLRVGTIPIEDFYYGLVLLLGVIYIYEKLRRGH